MSWRKFQQESVSPKRMRDVATIVCTTENECKWFKSFRAQLSIIQKLTKNSRNYCWAFDHFSSSSQYGIHGWLDPIPCKNLLIPNRQLEMIQSITINNHPIPPFPTIGSPPTSPPWDPTSISHGLRKQFEKYTYIYMIYTYTLHIVRCM